ncbi:hypothetical protein E2C01_074448 [Portunus trituberculatus]|uniref:Uncharacterized protein n=1 Tax=Portunus trituberculatus TaxID=210409 RepID=A0A5B7ICF1_PORTR|nr:hypothetical protein [Portunus trituberculatus]
MEGRGGALAEAQASAMEDSASLAKASPLPGPPLRPGASRLPAAPPRRLRQSPRRLLPGSQ